MKQKELPITTGAIALKLDVREHRVTYAIRALGIQPAARSGRYRLFDAKQVQQIKEFLER